MADRTHTRTRVLGRGLEALLPSPSPQPVPSGSELGVMGKLQAIEIDIDRVRPNPYQPREQFDEEALEELAQSIRQHGLIQPITVRAAEDGYYELITGERRWRACRRIGMPRIPAFVREANDETMLEMALVENIQREALNPLEIALGYRRLLEECSLTQEQIAERVGKDRSTVANFLRLLQLPDAIQAALRDGRISMGHARAMLGLNRKEEQLRVLEQTLRQNLSVRQVEELVRRLKTRPLVTAGPTQRPAPPFRTEAEDRLRAKLGTRVQIVQRSGGRGEIRVSFYSLEELNRLLELLETLPG
ncbi:MAG: ParB/RepB/Spo0J family partition protein [Bacteroidetes bacterium]|nr:ParB/RepB/Spo0J family partition protein [Bacteroidota bacterium]